MIRVISSEKAVLLTVTEQPDLTEPALDKSTTEQKLTSYEQAKKIALSKFNGNIKEIELDEDGCSRIYEVEIRKADMEIDACTGKILYAD